MSIAPPSDIILEVAQAADPGRLEAATARLAQLASGAAVGSADFSSALSTARSSAALGLSRAAAPSVPDDRSTHVVTRPTSPYQKFEAMVLRNFVETMLPKDADLFGDKASADPMRSMLADKIADQLAQSGRFGIARMIEHAKAAVPGAAEPAALSKPSMPVTLAASVLSTTRGL